MADNKRQLKIETTYSKIPAIGAALWRMTDCRRHTPGYNVSPEWVLYHLEQHEDEHRGEITTIRTLYASKDR